jgi:cytoskeletal protein CcmA (bactofilin family)
MIGKKNNGNSTKGNFEAPDRLNRIVEGTKLIGELIADSSLRIDGEVEGNVTCAGKVLVGENALIKGNLNCNEAEIEGKITGDIKVEALLTLREKARVEGNITTSKIEIHQGAVFLGNCSMGGMKSSSKTSNSSQKEQQPDIVY